MSRIGFMLDVLMTSIETQNPDIDVIRGYRAPEDSDAPKVKHPKSIFYLFDPGETASSEVFNQVRGEAFVSGLLLTKGWTQDQVLEVNDDILRAVRKDKALGPAAYSANVYVADYQLIEDERDLWKFVVYNIRVADAEGIEALPSNPGTGF